MYSYLSYIVYILYVQYSYMQVIKILRLKNHRKWSRGWLRMLPLLVSISIQSNNVFYKPSRDRHSSWSRERSWRGWPSSRTAGTRAPRPPSGPLPWAPRSALARRSPSESCWSSLRPPLRPPLAARLAWRPIRAIRFSLHAAIKYARYVQYCTNIMYSFHNTIVQ